MKINVKKNDCLLTNPHCGLKVRRHRMNVKVRGEKNMKVSEINEVSEDLK